jgi:hypothetical protein
MIWAAFQEYQRGLSRILSGRLARVAKQLDAWTSYLALLKRRACAEVTCIRTRACVTARDLVRSLLIVIARISHDEHGASATMVAIALPSLIGFGALGAETGLWYTIKLQNQFAADAAAISAAYEVIAGKTDVTNELTPTASEAAIQNGYTGTTPVVLYPYSDSVVSSGLAVTLQQTRQALLASMFLSGITVATKAVAVIEVFDNPCILALGPSGTDVEVSQSSRLNMPKCSVAANSISNSAIDLHDSTSSIIAATLVSPGEVSLQGNPIDPAAPPLEFTLTSRPMIGAPSIADPYAGMLTHSFLITGMPNATCRKPKKKGSIWVYQGTCLIHGKSLSQRSILLSANTQISGPWVIGTGETVELSPGTYWITDGNLTLDKGAAVTCSSCSGANGVTIILTTTGAIGGTVGNVHISRGATVTLQASNSGTFSGLLFVQDPLAKSSAGPTPDNGLDGGPFMNLTGLLYFPKTTVGFQGNPSATCTLLITKQVTIDGNSNFTRSGCASAGLTVLPTVNTVALAE